MFKTLILKKQKQIAKPLYKKYICATVATIFVLYLQLLMKPVFGPTQYFLLFPLVFIVSALGGIGPAILTIVLGGFGATNFLVDPLTHMNIPNASTTSVYKFLIFASSSLIGTWIVHLVQMRQQTLMSDIEILKESDRQFKMLSDASPSLIWMTNSEKVTTWFNKGWLDFTGMSLENSLLSNLDALVHPDDFKHTNETFIRAFDQRKDFRIEYRYKRKDGEYRWLLCNAVPVYNNGEFFGYIGVCVDIHEHKVAEERIKKALASRDQFLAVASHELKTPITSLTLQAQVFKRMLEKNTEFPKDKAMNISNQITRQVFRLDRLIDDMLDNSRINSGKFQIHPEEMDICELAKEVVEKINAQFMNKKVPTPLLGYCEESYAQDKFLGKWDKIKLDQVLTNLLTNAMKYGKDQPVELFIKPQEGSVLISVKDHGIGISAENIEKIFNRFHQVSGGTGSENGLGLGLFISKQIVKAHKGKIWVESEVGKGSTFYVELPTQADEASEDYNG